MTLRALLFLVLALFVVSVSPDASAQTTVITLVGTVQRRDGRQPLGVPLNVITLADCVASDKFTFQIKPVTGTNLSFQVWAGTTGDCANPQHLATLDGPQCWKVYESLMPPTGNFEISVRDVLPHNLNGPAPDTVCDDTAGNSTGNGTVTLYFVPVNGNVSGGTAANYPVNFDLQGPAPPATFGLEIGDGRLIPTWSATNNTDIDKYQLYCEPSDTCSSTYLTPSTVPGTMVPDDVATSTTGSTSTRGDVSGLENGQEYICAMAGVDKYGNLGKLSATACSTPKPVNGYYKSYVAAGGTAGGGYCSFGRAAAPAFAPVVVGALGALIARRRRRRSGR